MTTREDVIKYLEESKLLETCVDYQLKKSPKHFENRDDILQDAWIWILTYDEDKLLNAFDNKHMNALITGYLCRQIHSSTSEYYRKYVRFQEKTTEITQEIMDKY
mgnify:CR=1 FL=1